MKVKKITVTNVFGPLNRGDHELFKVLVEKLRQYNVDISAIARDPELCSTYFPEISFYEQLGKCTKGSHFWQIFLRIFYLFACISSPFLIFPKYFLPLSQRKALDSIKQSDLVISCPGGFLEDSNYSLYMHFAQLLVAIFFKKTLVMAPMSIGPIQNKFSIKLLKFILNRTDKIFVRELNSKNFCDILEVESAVSNDLAFFDFSVLDRNFFYGKSMRTNKPSHIAVTVINWSFPRSKDPNLAKNLYISSMSKVLTKLHQYTSLPVKFIVQVESDLLTIEKVKKLLNFPCEILYDAKTPDKIKNVLENSYCLIASRFHSAIFSLSVGCPMIALSYLPKTSGMLDLYGLPELYRPIEDFEPDELAESLIEMASNRETFKKKVIGFIDSLKKVGDPFFDYLSFKIGSFKEKEEL